MRGTLTGAAAAAVLLAGALSPARGTAPGEHAPPPAPRSDSVTVWVESYYWGPVHVYAREGGRLHSIGVVVTNDTVRARVGLVSSRSYLRLVAEPVGSRRRYETGRIAFEPGDRIEWIVGTELPMSTVLVYEGEQGQERP